MTFGRKAAIAVAAFATVGSTLFGGAALAGDDYGHGHDKGNGHHKKVDKKADKKVFKVDQTPTAVGGRGGDIDDTCSHNILSNLLGAAAAVSVFGDATAANCSPASGDGGDADALALLGR